MQVKEERTNIRAECLGRNVSRMDKSKQRASEINEKKSMRLQGDRIGGERVKVGIKRLRRSWNVYQDGLWKHRHPVSAMMLVSSANSRR